MTSVTHTTRAANDAPPLTVQEVSRPPAPFLRFVDQVVEDGASDVDFRFSQSVLTRFDVDVVHVVDSELDHLLGAPASAPLQRLIAASALARNLRRHRIALVRTLVEEHRVGSSTLERRARQILDDATARFIVHDSAAGSPDPGRTSVIPHAHFRDRFLGFPRHPLTPGLILIPAAGELPENADHLLAVPRVAKTPGLRVRLVGLAAADRQAAATSMVARHPHQGSTRWERLSDGALVAEITSAELVVLPQVTSPPDMQMMFVALSLSRPVLTPRTPAASRVAAQVGPGWLCLSDGPIAAVDVDHALERTRDVERDPQPDLTGRELGLTRSEYAELFQQVAVTRVHEGR